jgi:hypothetical protein
MFAQSYMEMRCLDLCPVVDYRYGMQGDGSGSPLALSDPCKKAELLHDQFKISFYPCQILAFSLRDRACRARSLGNGTSS